MKPSESDGKEIKAEPLRTIEDKGNVIEVFDGGRAVIKKPIPEQVIPARDEETEIFQKTLQEEKEWLIEENSRMTARIDATLHRIAEIDEKLNYFKS